MNSVQCSIDFTRLSLAVKDTFRLHKFRRSNSVRISSPVSRGYGRIHINAIPEEVEPLNSLSSGNGSFQTDTQLLLHDLELAVDLLPEKLRSTVLGHEERLELIELVLDYGRKPLARFPSGDSTLSQEVVNDRDLEDAVAAVGGFDDSNRAGLEGTLHRISCIRDRHDRIYGLTIRIGRAVTTETAGLVKEPLSEGKSILLIGPPGVGKTSAIRNLCKMLSETCKKRVMIVDTSSEIAGPGRIPHQAVGESRRMEVKCRSDQHNVMIEAVQNHMPEVIVIDEIGRRDECHAARAISQRGVQLLATTHGRRLEDMVKDQVLRDLVGGVGDVILGDKRAKMSQKNKKIAQERIDASSFDVIVEMADRTRWRIHYNANKAVDAILANHSPEAEIRYLDEDGNMIVTKEGEERNPKTIAEAERILNACSDLEILQVRSDAPLEELKERFKVLMDELVERRNEDKTMKQARGRVVHAYDYLSFYCNFEADIDVNGETSKEALRILKAPSDLEVLQTTDDASKAELRNRYRVVFKRVRKKKNEDEATQIARRRVSLAYTKLLRFHNVDVANTLDHENA